MVDELLLYHNILLGGVTIVDRAVASLKAIAASEPSRSATGHADVVPVGAEQVDALIALAAIVQVVSFVPTVLADRAEASRERLVDATVCRLERWCEALLFQSSFTFGFLNAFCFSGLPGFPFALGLRLVAKDRALRAVFADCIRNS